jgi:hypothetical protein
MELRIYEGKNYANYVKLLKSEYIYFSGIEMCGMNHPIVALIHINASPTQTQQESSLVWKQFGMKAVDMEAV